MEPPHKPRPKLPSSHLAATVELASCAHRTHQSNPSKPISTQPSPTQPTQPKPSHPIPSLTPPLPNPAHLVLCGRLCHAFQSNPRVCHASNGQILLLLIHVLLTQPVHTRRHELAPHGGHLGPRRQHAQHKHKPCHHAKRVGSQLEVAIARHFEDGGRYGGKVRPESGNLWRVAGSH